MATNARAPIAESNGGPRIGTYSEQSLYNEIHRRTSQMVEQQIASNPLSGFAGFLGSSNPVTAARGAVQPASQLIARTLIAHKDEDVKALADSALEKGGESKIPALVAARALEVRRAIGSSVAVQAFKLDDMKLTEMTGVKSDGSVVTGADGKPIVGSLYDQLYTAYTNERTYQQGIAIAKMEAEAAAKKVQIASIEPQAPLPAPPGQPEPGAKAAGEAQANTASAPTAPAAPAAPVSPPAQPAAKAPTADEEDAAKKLAELKEEQARALAAQKAAEERQRTAELAQNTDTVSYSPASTAGSGDGGFIDTIMGFLGGITETWNENVGGPMKRGANALNRNGLGWLGPLALFGIVLAGAFGGMGMAGLLLIGFMALMAVGGSGLFGGSAQAGEPGASPANYDQQLQAGRDGPMQNINYEPPNQDLGMSPLFPNGGVQRPPRER